MFLIFCLFYKITVSCITKGVTEPQIKLMMIRCLEMIDQIYSSISIVLYINDCNSVTLEWEEATKGLPFPRPKLTSKLGGSEAFGNC